MDRFLQKRELVSFSVVDDSFPNKKDFETEERTDGSLTIYLLDSIVKKATTCGERASERNYKNGELHGRFVSSEVGLRAEGSFSKGKPHGLWTFYSSRGSIFSFSFVRGNILEWNNPFREGGNGVVSRNKKTGSFHVLERKGNSVFQCQLFEALETEYHSCVPGMNIPYILFKNYRCFTREFSPVYREQLNHNFKEKKEGFWPKMYISRWCFHAKCRREILTEEETKRLAPFPLSTLFPGE
nr:MORN repeat containing protein [Marseillevirus futianmevirus]